MFFFLLVASVLANDDIDVQVGLKVPKIIHQTWKTNTPPEKWKFVKSSIFFFSFFTPLIF